MRKMSSNSVSPHLTIRKRQTLRTENKKWPNLTNLYLFNRSSQKMANKKIRKKQFDEIVIDQSKFKASLCQQSLKKFSKTDFEMFVIFIICAIHIFIQQIEREDKLRISHGQKSSHIFNVGKHTKKNIFSNCFVFLKHLQLSRMYCLSYSHEIDSIKLSGLMLLLLLLQFLLFFFLLL